MCRPGCQAVAEAIVAGGLESYYRHRSENAANPEALPKALSEELQLYDRPDVQRGFVRHEGELAETSLMIEGISCARLRLADREAPAPVAWRGRGAAQPVQPSPARALAGQPVAAQPAVWRTAPDRLCPYQPDRATERLAMENRHALRQLGVAGLL